MGDARVVHENVDLAERRLGGVRKLGYGRPVAQIAWQYEDAFAKLSRKFLQLLGVGAREGVGSRLH